MIILLAKLFIALGLIWAMCYLMVLAWNGLKWLMNPTPPPEEKDDD